MTNLPHLREQRVAVVGSSPSLLGRGLGPEIDGHDVVIRCNHGWQVKGVADSYGERVDLLVVGNISHVTPYLGRARTYPVLATYGSWHQDWKHHAAYGAGVDAFIDEATYRRLWGPDLPLPLAGTLAALWVADQGPRELSLYGMDLHTDTRPSAFPRHHNRSNAWHHPALDLEKLNNLPARWVK